VKKIAIIVAGGTGHRMNSTIPKQFLLLQGKPILFHTLNQFKKANSSIILYVVLPKNQMDFWAKLCSEFPEINATTPHILVGGGETRFHSSQNGLAAITGTEDCLIAIHDGVRPLIKPELISSAFEYAELHGNAILSVPTKDSIRKWDSISQKYVAVKRDEIRIIQTPQIFSLKSLRKAFNQSYSMEFTDDASVIESTGETIHLVEGDYSNLKITTSEDLNLAESLMKSAY
jgi:2-C-methyl-D-erythritol 4-phosphate cytidylyltransferase